MFENGTQSAAIMKQQCWKNFFVPKVKDIS
jgi:hypothetical protein